MTLIVIWILSLTAYRSIFIVFHLLRLSIILKKLLERVINVILRLCRHGGLLGPFQGLWKDSWLETLGMRFLMCLSDRSPID